MNAPVTLLYVITGTNIGGAEKALSELVRRIDPARYRVVVCSLKRPGAYAARLAAHANGFYHLGLGEAGGLRAVINFIPALLRLIRIMRHERPRIVHCFLFRASMMGRLAALLCPGAAVIAGVRVQERSALKYILERLTRSLVACYTAVSDEVRHSMIERAHIDPDNIITIYNGIECRGRDLPAGPVGIAGAPVRLALIGRLHCQKGHSVLLDALNIIISSGRQAKLFFAGEGPDEAHLRQKARDLGIAASVTFAGLVDDPLAFMAGIDIVVLPSLWEGMPNVLLEAMAASRPIVATRLGGIAELVRDGESALLCDPGRAEPLAAAIMRLMDDWDLGRRLAAAARSDVEKRFDIARTVAETQALYGRLLLRQPGRRSG
ncbi:MAG: glycosyltransferase [Deltaproteobacteria bacterium]|nr:glycosyltransferase [Deltaproteobacteria bacterium]